MKELEKVAVAYDRVQASEQELRKSRKQLHDAMRAAHRAGASYTAIGRVAGGISRQRVAEIVGD